MKQVVRRLLIILSVLFIGFLILVFSNSVILNTGVVTIVIIIILKQFGLFLGKSDLESDDDDYIDSDFDGDSDD